MPNELKAFYKPYVKWVDAGAPSYRPFDRSKALCWNLTVYTENEGMPFAQTAALLGAQEAAFKAAGKDHTLPFNLSTGYSLSYNEESHRSLCHTNPHRTKWAREHAQ